MKNAEHQKVHVERAIDRARDGVSERINELDRRFREAVDIQSQASEHAGSLVAGGAVVGFLFGFGLPRTLRRMIAVSVPLALIAMKVQQSRSE